MRVLKTAAGKVIDVAFSPDGRAVAAAVGGAGAFLWNLDSPALAPVRVSELGHWRGALSFSPDGRQLAWLTPIGRTVYDRDARAVSTEPAVPLGTVGLSPCGTRAVTLLGLPKYELAGWRLKEGDWVRQWHLSTRALSVLEPTLAPAGDRLALFARPTNAGRWWEQPMRVEVRDATTGKTVCDGAYPYSYHGKLAFHPRGEQLACAHEMTLVAWELPAGGAPRLARNDNRKHFTALAYHPDGARLFATSNDATVHVFDARTLERTTRYTWRLNRLRALALSADGALAAAGSASGEVVLWDVDS
jgi:WD40 repeat protein